MHYVYLMKCGDELYKVGVAKSAAKRLAGIQTSNPNPVQLIISKLVSDAYAVEQNIHIILKEFKANGGKEWFKLTPQQAIEICTIISKNPELDHSERLTVQEQVFKNAEMGKRIDKKLDMLIAEADHTSELKEPIDDPKPEKISRKVVDEMLVEQAIDIIKTNGRASTSLLQRKLMIGYGRAARLMDKLEAAGIIGPLDGAKARKVLV